MPNNVNRFSRLHKIFSRAAVTEKGNVSIDAWANVFDIATNDERERRYAVIGLLKLLYEETKAARATMEATQYSKDLYDDALSRIQGVIGIDMLMQGWGSCRNNITREALLALKWCAETLPSEESLIEDDELRKLREEVAEFRRTVIRANLCAELKEFLNRQLAIIEDAIYKYRVIGIRAFDIAQTESFTNFVQAHEVVKHSEKSEEVRKLAGIWARVRRYTDEFGRCVRLLKDAKDLYDIGSGFLS